MTEHDIQNKIRVMASRYGLCFRTNVGRVRLPDGRYFDTGLPRGFPDLTCVIRGRAVFIEAKALGGRVSPEQEKIHRILRNHGAHVAVCYSVEDAEKFILKEVLKNET